jgi:hypothetical protein
MVLIPDATRHTPAVVDCIQDCLPIWSNHNA